jgi:hypothetical protein
MQILCVRDDERIGVKKGEIGTLEVSITKWNKWHEVEFPATQSRAAIHNCSYTEQDFQKHYEVIPEIQERIRYLKGLLKDVEGEAAQLRSESNRLFTRADGIKGLIATEKQKMAEFNSKHNLRETK